jgi:hypothetical protein
MIVWSLTALFGLLALINASPVTLDKRGIGYFPITCTSKPTAQSVDPTLITLECKLDGLYYEDDDRDLAAEAVSTVKALNQKGYNCAQSGLSIVCNSNAPETVYLWCFYDSFAGYESYNNPSGFTGCSIMSYEA